MYIGIWRGSANHCALMIWQYQFCNRIKSWLNFSTSTRQSHPFLDYCLSDQLLTELKTLGFPLLIPLFYSYKLKFRHHPYEDSIPGPTMLSPRKRTMGLQLSGVEQVGTMESKNSISRNGHNSDASEQRNHAKVQNRVYDLS